MDNHNQLAAFAFLLEPYNTLVFETQPNINAEIESYLFAWGNKAADKTPGTLGTVCHAEDIHRITLLESHGFVLQRDISLRLFRDLKGPIPSPQLPEGFTIRSITGEDETDAFVALHKAAFGTLHMNREKRLAIMRAPNYDPSLDLIAIAPDGRFAGYCSCSISSTEGEQSSIPVGHTDPVAVHPDFQKMGLARALLLSGARLLQERGMARAMLGTDSSNLPMQKAAEAAGYLVFSKKLWYEKALRKTDA